MFEKSKTEEVFFFFVCYTDQVARMKNKHNYEGFAKVWPVMKEEYEYVTIMEKGDEAFVRYKSRINGMLVQNTEHFLFQDGKIKGVDVFFGRPEEDPTSQNA